MAQKATNSAASFGRCVLAKRHRTIEVKSSTAGATVGGESGASTGAVRLSLGGAVSALTGLSAAAWPGVPVSDGGLAGVGSMLLSPRDLARSGFWAGDVETGEMSGSRHPP